MAFEPRCLLDICMECIRFDKEHPEGVGTKRRLGGMKAGGKRRTQRAAQVSITRE